MKKILFTLALVTMLASNANAGQSCTTTCYGNTCYTNCYSY